jgi:transcriptional regulator
LYHLNIELEVQESTNRSLLLSKIIIENGAGIVGFKIKIEKIEGKAKLSQNHPVDRQELIIKQLENTSDQNNIQIADLMK